MAVLMTGVTGAVGLPLYRMFKKQYSDVFCIVRNSSQRNLPEIEPEHIIEGDITQPLCGVGSYDMQRLLEHKITKVVHLAGLVKFDDAISDEIWNVNYGGTSNVLELAQTVNAGDFHYVSTAYVFGEQRNPYESSKYEAEKQVSESALPYSIYRIGIVVGDSKTGHTDGYDGYYGFMAGMHTAAQLLRQKKNKNGDISLPINLVCSKESTLNLVPVDWLIDSMSSLIEKPCSNQTFYLVNPNPPAVFDVMSHSLKTLGIRDCKFHEPDEYPTETGHSDRLINIIQKSVSKVLKRYEPYVTHEEKFPIKQTIENGKKDLYSEFPSVNSLLLEKYLHYALENNFGRGA